MIIKLRLKNLIHSTLLVCAVSLSASAQQPTQKVVQPTSQLRVVSYGGDFQTFLAQMPNTFDVTIGFEVSASQPRSYVAFEVYDASLDDVMNALVKAKPLYRWAKSDNVINVLPSEDATPFLETVINSFQATGVTADEAVAGLLRLGEVQYVGKSLQLRLSPTLVPPNADPGTRFSLNLQGVTLRQALSRIASQSGLRFWTFERSGARCEFFSIRFYR